MCNTAVGQGAAGGGIIPMLPFAQKTQGKVLKVAERVLPKPINKVPGAAKDTLLDGPKLY